MRNIIFINSHPIQYFAPLYTFMNKQHINTVAWYCSEESFKGAHDKEFAVNVKWDIPLLKGYKYVFYKNHSWKPSYNNGFFGLINMGMVWQLFKEPRSIIIVHGWSYCTHLLILMLGKLAGHTICIRSETPQKQEVLKKGLKQAIKKMILKSILFPQINYFLYIGKQNYLFYKDYKISEDRLISCPYSVDNSFFKSEHDRLKSHRSLIRQKIGIPPNSPVILFVGKYIDKKRPLDLLYAFNKLNISECWLIMVGEGELRQKMELFIMENNLKRVILTGFINQSSISEYYSISDVFVMCSSVGETWGLSVNEAMNFNLPLVISDITGCSDDLVREGDNGYVFTTENINELASKLERILIAKKLTHNIPSQSIIDQYSYAEIVKQLKANL